MRIPQNKKMPHQVSQQKPAPKKPKPKPKPKKPKPQYYGGLGGYRGVNVNKAKRLANGLMLDELRDLDTQQSQANRDYARGNQDLNIVHSRTGAYLKDLAARNQQAYAQQARQTAASTQALQGMLGQTYSGAQQGATDEMARLGIEGGGNLSQLNADQANAQSLAAISGQNAASTGALANSNTAGAMALLQGMNQGSYQQGVGQNLNRRNDQLNKVMQAKQNVRRGRRDTYFQLLEQLQQTGWQQYLQNRQLRKK